jgi:hypothetical protein
MLSKRNYKITPETRSFGTTFKVEMWNDFGMKRTVYENNVNDASEVIMDWWENSEKEFDKMNSLNNAIHEAHQIDRKSGILKGNRDGLD